MARTFIVRRLPPALTGAALLLACAGPVFAASAGDPWPSRQKGLWPLGMLQKENLAKQRSKPPFDLTGVWIIKPDPATGGFGFTPIPKLTPAAQKIYEEAQQAQKAGKAFNDDTGVCWPAGLPKWWTRIWPTQITQHPTGLTMIGGLFNPVRWVYMDGRGHADPDLIQTSFQGDSIGRWEADTLVIDTIGFGGEHHWIQNGVPASDQLHVVERIRMAPDAESFTVELTMTDPVNWVGEWKNTKRFVPVKGEDVLESVCRPDVNEGYAAMRPEHHTRD